ncbi:hypothetical protein YC2023_044064 [Brassica napus]
MLGDAKVDEDGNVYDAKDGNLIYFDKDGEDREINISPAICFLRGKAYGALQNRSQARQWYKAAIKTDPLCYEVLLVYANSQLQACGPGNKLQHAFFMQAKAICPSDPLVYNELRVVSYHMKEYGKAVRWFEKTLAHIPSVLTEIWEPTVVNLAHAFRKLRKYREAISYYERALTLSTKSLSTYSGLAYTYHLQGDFSAAISHYHKALWLKPDDQFCTEMLNVALLDECQNGLDSTVELC